VISDLTQNISADENQPLMVIPALPQSGRARIETTVEQTIKSRPSILPATKNEKLRESSAGNEIDLVTALEETTLYHSSIEGGAVFEHTEYVGATKPSVSVELAIGYTIAVFHAAQLATKSLATVGANVIHSPAFYAANLDHEHEMERGDS
jgi:hypothetical protein